MKNRTISLLLIILFFSLLVVPTVLFLIVGENAEHALDEKRELAQFPEQFDERFLAQLETWYNDHVPYRMTLITWQKTASQAYGVNYRRILHPFLSAMLSPEWYREESHLERVPGKKPFFAPIEGKYTVYGRDDWLFYIHEQNMDYFTGSNALTDAAMEDWKKTYEDLNTLCNAKGIRMAILLAPNKEQVYGEYVPSYFINPGIKRGQQFCDYMKQSGINYLYPLQELISRKQEYVLYYKQDTHWNSIGGYIGATQLMKSLNIPAAPIDKLQIEAITTEGGDLSDMTGFFSEYTDYIVDYKPEITVNSELFEDSAIEIIHSSAETSCKMVMICDSFGGAVKDYLAKEFSESVVAHYSYCNNEIVTDSIDGLSKGDVLILLDVERYDETLVNSARQLIQILE